MVRAQFEAAKKGPATDPRQVRSGADDTGIIQRVDAIIEEAVSRGATEIHFEPHQDRLTVRTRSGSALTPVDIEVPTEMVGNVINRIKVLSAMDITRTKIPQSGYFKLTLGERTLEMYSYVIPTLYGEKAVVKVQYKVGATMKLEQLGMTPKMLAGYTKAVARRAGLYLVTGPPGSGRRTTVYATILQALQPDQLALGFDPVIKYEIPGMVQGKHEDKSEFTMAEAIHALMQQEPDVAYIGDVVSLEEARAVVQGAFAKRIVLCRMNANDTVNALQNLLDMGMPSFLLAASLSAVSNQRLTRRLCPKCREAYPADKNIERDLGTRLPENARFFRAKGCDACDNTGFSGTTALFELYLPSEELNKMIVAKAPVQELRQQAQKEGLVSIKHDGILKAMHGLVTLEDALNAL